MSISERIRGEREDLDMSQTAFAKIAGTTKQTLFSWETGKTFPNANQLALLADAGVDVNYILTGIRSTASPWISESDREACNTLIDVFMGLSDERREELRRFAEALQLLDVREGKSRVVRKREK